MIIYWIGAFLFWLVAVVMVFYGVNELKYDYDYKDRLIANKIYVFMCMIIGTTIIMIRTYPDLLKAIELGQW